MRVVIQRVSKASVSVKGKAVGNINAGYFILLGVKEGDTEEDAKILAEKTSKLRVMSDNNGKMNLSLSDINASVLAVSQFTLYADTKKGNRPSFIKAAEPKKAQRLYEYFIERLMRNNIKVETGRFGEYMTIDVILDGPVTIIIES